MHPKWSFGLRGFLVILTLLLGTACDENPVGPEAPGVSDDNPVAALSVSGTVMNASTGEAVEGAKVSIETDTVTTGLNGRFQFTDVAPGSVTIHCVAAGYEDFQQTITVSSGRVVRHNLSVIRIERFEISDFALYAPAGISTIRGVFLALGGPDTRGFATGSPFGAPAAEVEAALQQAGQDIRALAADIGFAVLGTSLVAMANGPDSDQLLVSTLQEAATLSGRPELATAPLLLYGMSAGASEASGFTVRNPERVAALFLKVPALVESPFTGEALSIPAYIVQAEFDAFVDNDGIATTFETNRRAGALWALAMEPGVPHHSLSSTQRALTINWMREIVQLRLRSVGVLSRLVDADGWVGDRASGKIAAWGELDGDPASMSWFPSYESARAWLAFVGTAATVESSKYELTAVIQRFDSGWGYDLTGARYTAVLTIHDHPADASDLSGRLDGWRFIDVDGSETLIGSTLLHGHIDRVGDFVLESDQLGWAMKGRLTESAELTGSFGCCGHISGSFKAVRMSEPPSL
ncbi:MAG: carboxypeptidase regulatory-like domain-containing protein [Rhodothermales bacterium]|nr:carboxypeptidase regulatory-like domain-containing protein [Rhodothermales bacterium]